MPPKPPSQAGKFKPRKPVKKVRPGAVITPGSGATPSADSAAARPNVVTSSDAAAAAGGNKGGGGGKQKPPRRSFNQPMPQGSVFFTGNNVTAAKKGRSRTAGVKGKNDGGGGEGGEEEVVVGQLDVAIGSSAAALAKLEQQRAKQAAAESSGDYYAEDNKPTRTSGRTGKQSGAALDYIMYDSDSDNDIETWSAAVLQPTELQFTSTLDHLDEQQQQLSPFHPTESRSEYSDYYLFQLPTRLPPLKQDDEKAAVKSDEAVVAAVMPEVPEVVTAPILAGSFDNALATAKAGKLGRIQVYKSGKTVLVMNGPEGKIRMNLTEGLSCGFYQQAVMINTNDGSYTPLGDIKKTIVVTPDIERK